MTELGHKVTLYATPGSKVPPGGRLRLLPSTYGNINLEVEHRIRDCTDEILSSDLILDCSHNHLMAEEIRFYHQDHMHKVLNVLNGIVSHVPRPEPYNLVVGSRSWYNCLVKGVTQFYGTFWGKAYGESLTPVKPDQIAGIIPWAIDCNDYPIGKEKGDYYLFFSRLTPYKGAHTAMKLARKMGFKLKLAFPLALDDHKHWYERYKPLIESTKNVETVINPSHKEKVELLQGAKALILPYESHEPFGLIVIEAMSCGCPVITSNLGAMPEIIQEGGIICRSFDDFVEAVKNAEDLKPEDARRNAERYDYRKVVPRYLDLDFSISPRPAKVSMLVARPLLDDRLVDLNLMGISLWVNTRDIAGGSIAKHGYYEKPETELFLNNINETSRIIDVGASYGYYSILGAKKAIKGTVHAFEPNPYLLRYLLENISLNQTWNVTAYGIALSDGVAVSPLFVSTEHPEGSTLLERLLAPKNVLTCNVASTTLDLLFKENPCFDFLKVDVEGAEFKVLSGAEGIIRESPEISILVEYNVDALRKAGESPKECLKWIMERFEYVRLVPTEVLLNEDNLEALYPKLTYLNLFCKSRRGA